MRKREDGTDMTKKIVLGALLVGLIGILVAGAVIRTIDKTGNVAEARGLEGGRGRGSEIQRTGTGLDQPLEANGQRNGAGGYGQAGQGRGAGNERQYPNLETVPEDWTTIEGTVLQAPAAGVDLILQADSGEEVAVGTGPGYMESQGFTLEAGERVQVQGYWEDDEFKATRVMRLQDGQTIALRDEAGRPAWAGGGRRTTEQQTTGEQVIPGQGGDTQGGFFGGQGREDVPGDGTGTGQAQVEEWLTMHGTVTSMDGDMLVVQTTAGEEIVVENRPWWFVQEQGFSAKPGDELTLVGFYENDAFEVGAITNLTSRDTVSIREESGRPLWAGRGRRGS
jgi:hypothetical protein